jgi:hypothetical protein
MKYQALQVAISEAERFLKKANELMVNENKLREQAVVGPYVIDGYSKETAAAKRASMDLTRALAELRKP